MVGPRGQTGPADLRVPPDDEVHVSQIRNFRRSRETRRTLSSSAQHRQREGAAVTATKNFFSVVADEEAK